MVRICRRCLKKKVGFFFIHNVLTNMVFFKCYIGRNVVYKKNNIFLKVYSKTSTASSDYNFLRYSAE